MKKKIKESRGGIAAGFRRVTNTARNLNPKQISLIVLAGLLIGSSILAFAFLRPQAVSESDKATRTTLTSAVELRQVVSRVITRGTITTANTIDVSCHPSGGEAQVKVFTQPPKLDAQLNEGDVLAAVNGRPVLVLEGEIASFREMTPGSTGVDIRQLQEALTRLGHRISDPKGTMGSDTQKAVTSWYQRSGFTANGPSKEGAAQLRSLRESIAQAKVGIENANRELNKAQQGPNQSAIWAAENGLDEARKALATAKPEERATAERNLKIAEEALAVAKRAPDTSGQQAAVKQAQEAKARLEADYAGLSQSIGTSVPFCEVVFIPKLPAAVAAIHTPKSGGQGGDDAKKGGTETTGWATLAPGSLIIKGQLAAAEASQIKVGATVTYRRDGDQQEQAGTVSEILERSGEGHVPIIITPKNPLAPKDRGSNIRIMIEIGATEGQVLAVPAAALTNRPDGTAVVAISRGSQTEEVPVIPGLSGDGYLEIKPATAGAIKAGDQVVTG